MITMKDLHEAQKALNNIPRINEGGCGVVALALLRLFKRSKVRVKPVEIVYGRVFMSSHIAIKKGKEIIDSTGKVDTSKIEQYQYTDPLTEKKLVNIIKDKKSWNTDFNRSNINLIEKVLNVDLSDIKDK
jgi:hypothetical protein